MKRFINIVVIVAFLLSACSSGGPGPGTQTTQTQSLPTVAVNTTSVPSVQPTAEEYLSAWQAEDFTKMYGMLSKPSQDALAVDKFTKRYSDTETNLTLQKMDFQVLQSLVINPESAQVAYHLNFHTATFGDIQRDTLMNLSIENGQWKIKFDDAMIMPELRGGNYLMLDIKVPPRGSIKDINGQTIVADADAYALGVIPGQIDKTQEARLVNELASLTGKTTDAIRAMYKDSAGQDWYVAIGEAPAQAVDERVKILSGLGGVVYRPFTSRYYTDGGVGPHAVGYVQAIPADQLNEYKRLGYRGDERVGMTGLEKWAENALSGQRGTSLYVFGPDGKPVTRISQIDSLPAESVTTTLDKDVQIGAQKAIEGFNGAVVAVEINTGRIVAMVSSPGFDPNLFEPNNYNSGYQLGPMINNPDRPLINRAAQSSYPLGSVFKIITMSAALESGVYTKSTTYECGHEFTELDGVTYYDWTYDHGVAASGLLTLPEGLMRSCNPYFYHIGLDLFRQKGTKIVSDMARAFGLGKETGIGQISEDGGNVEDPQTENDAVQMAIGQSTLLVTPLQVARFVAAIANGGTLYQPQLVEKVANQDDVASYEFKPVDQGKLPISQENLKIIQDAMRSVVANPRGTAYRPLAGLGVPIYGKTGTAQNAGGKPHAWFAGYSAANNKDKPDIAVVVFAENAGEGSEIAAPIFRRVMEDYFFGQPSALYPWEAKLYVTFTPTDRYTKTPTLTPIPPTETPTPEASPTPQETPTP